MRAKFDLTAIAAASLLWLAAPAAHAFDTKTFPATSCQPKVPNTAANEIRLMANGIANYSNVNKQVVCPVPKDLGVNWTVDNMGMQYYFMTGPVAGRVACTSYVSGPVFGAATYGTSTTSPANIPPNTRSSGSLDLIDPDDDIGIAPASVICTLSPKTQLGGFFVNETGDTDGDT